MTLRRRQFLQLASGAAMLPAVSRFAWAQSYPARPVRVIVANAPGIAGDTLARLLGQWLSERLGQPFVIENRPGGGNSIGTEAVVRAAADGYTLLMVGPPNAITATLYDKLNFNFIRDIAPVASISREPYVLLVNPSVSAKTIPEFIAYARANPGKLNIASAGNGTASHMAAELQDDGRRRVGARSLSRLSARAHRPDRRPGAGPVPHYDLVDRHHQVRPCSPAGGDDVGALGVVVAGHSELGRFRAGL
jgi:hypothetical protein